MDVELSPSSAADHRTWLDRAVAFGFVTYGAVYLLVAWLALELALGDHAGKPSSSGALAEVSRQPFGTVLLWAIATGMLVLVLWRLLEAVRGEPRAKGARAWLNR